MDRAPNAVCLNGRSWALRRERAAVQMKIGGNGLISHPLSPHVLVIFHYASAAASGRHETLFQCDFSSHIQSRAAVPLEQRQLQDWRCGCAEHLCCSWLIRPRDAPLHRREYEHCEEEKNLQRQFRTRLVSSTTPVFPNTRNHLGLSPRHLSTLATHSLVCTV